MKTRIGFLLFIGLALLLACDQPSNSNISSNRKSNITNSANSNSLQINRRDLKRETEKIKKDLEETKQKSTDPKIKSSEIHENLQDSQLKKDGQNR